ncbi:MAG: 50S ribosomal protein L24 [bacterium]|nr:50S ribosomal protein L24 [bacterium]
MHVRKNDMVLVIAGNDAGKRGRVLKVFPKKGTVIVEGVRFIKRHTKPNQKLPNGGIIEREAPISISNVMVIDPQTNQPTRVGHRRIEENGKKRSVRVSKKSGSSF